MWFCSCSFESIHFQNSKIPMRDVKVNGQEPSRNLLYLEESKKIHGAPTPPSLDLLSHVVLKRASSCNPRINSVHSCSLFFIVLSLSLLAAAACYGSSRQLKYLPCPRPLLCSETEQDGTGMNRKIHRLLFNNRSLFPNYDNSTPTR